MPDKSHSINLTRMWRALTADSHGSLADSTDDDSPESNRRIDLTNISEFEFAPPARLIRNFNCPTGMTAASRSALVFENLPVGTICYFNGQQLGTINDSLTRFGISQGLQHHNQILIELLAAIETEAGPVIRVRLEIS